MSQRHKQGVLYGFRMIACIGILLCLAFFIHPALAQIGEDTSAPSVDAVILMDHSKSMDTNDKDSHRIDAVQMFISLCDMNSRVAFVPFSGSVMEGADTAFTDISSRILRDAKLNEIEKYRLVNFIYDDRRKPYITLKDTDYGQALNYAVKLIMDRTDTTNDPMIILLTDGKNAIKDGLENFTVTEWDDAIKSFVENKYRKYTAADADLLCKDAVLCAIENEIPVFTLAIPDTLSKNSEQYALEHELEQISIDTGVGETFTTLSANNVAELPQYFGNMLASRIGSNLIHNLNPIPVDGEQGKYQIILPIRNSSVYEANIYIPTDTIDVSGFGLYPPNESQNDLSGGGKDVIVFECKEFRLYKIIQPRALGEWTLEFAMKDAAAPPESITFSILYNYNITLKTQLGRKPEDMQSLGTGMTLGKGDILFISSSFYNTQDRRINDLLLFQNQSAVAWESIHCNYELCDSSGNNVIWNGELPGSFDSFSGVIDLSSVDPDDFGYNQLSAGNYILRIITDGAGLHRENELKITLTNNEPVAASTDTDTLRFSYIVDDPFSSLPGGNQPLVIALEDEFTDPDHDKLFFTGLAPVDDADRHLNLTLEAGTLRGTAVASSHNGLSSEGEVEYTVMVSDGDAQSKPYHIIVEISSIAQDILNSYRCDTEILGYDPNGMTITKGQPITVTMNLQNNGTGEWDTADVIRLFDGELRVYNAANTAVPLLTVPMERSGTGQLTCTYLPSGSSQPLVLQCVYSLSDFPQASVKSSQVAIRVVNHLVQSDAAAVAAVPTDISFIPDGVSLWSEQSPTSADDLVIALDTLFSDADASDELTYSYSPRTDETSPLGVTFDTQDNRLTLKPQHSGVFELTITATDDDSDGNAASVTLEFTVTDLAEVIYYRYDCITEVSGYDKYMKTAAKNTNIMFSMYLQDSVTKTRDTTNAIRNFTDCAILVYDADNLETPIQTLPLTSSNQYTAVYPTPKKADTLVIKYKYAFADARLAPITDTLVKLHVVNAAPETVDGAMEKIPSEIRFIPGQVSMWTPFDPTPESDLRIQLQKLFIDPDADDDLTFTCTQTDETSPVSAVIDHGTDTLTLTAQHKGKFTLTITAEDTDPNTQVTQITKEITVVDLAEEAFQMFEYVTETNGNVQGSTIADKDTDITFTLLLRDTETGMKDTTTAIRNFEGELLVYDAADPDIVLETIPMNATTAFSGTYHTPVHSAKLVVRYRYTFADPRQGLLTGLVTNVSVENHNPEIVQSVLGAIPLTIGYIPESNVLWIPEAPTPDRLLKISLASLFTDADACDTLHFTVEVIGRGNSLNVQYNEDKKIVTLVPVSDGPFSLLLTAADSDPLGMPHEVPLNFSVRDLKAKWSIYWLVILLVFTVSVLLTLEIWHMLKPRYPKHAWLFVFDGGAIIESEKVNLKKSKKTYKLSKLLNASIAQRNRISTAVLNSIHIKPSHRRDGIRVRCTASAEVCIVLRGDKKLARRYAAWKMEESIVIESTATKSQIRILLTQDSENHLGPESVNVEMHPAADENTEVVDGFDLPDNLNR